MEAIPYRLKLLEPVMVSQTHSGEENSAVGLPFIPGGAIRGALVAFYLKQHPTEDLAADAQARQWFLDGVICYLNAYPWYQAEKARMLPIPQAWFTEKDLAGDEHSSLYDWAVDPAQRLEQPKPPKNAEFCHLTCPGSGYDENGKEVLSYGPRESRVVLYKPSRQVNVHIALVETNQRDESNKVFRYDALAAGEVLAGAIVAPDDVDLTTLYALLSDASELFIGGARTAGYGRVRLEVDDIVTGWQEYPADSSLDSGEIVVTLLSDTLVRGRDGQITGDLDCALADLLGLASLETRRKRRYQRLSLVGGFNRKWGLPLPQAWALEAGTVYVYEAGAFDPEDLRRKVALGIGERRAEGFGRIAVNWHTASTVKRQKLIKPQSLRPKLSMESRDLAREMAQRRLRLLLERRLIEYLSKAKFKRLPSNTQLSRVRNAVQQALAAGDVEPVKDHLRQLKAAREQLDRARVNGLSMMAWIQARVDSLDVEQQLLGGGSLPQVAGEQANLDDNLRRIYTLRLIDGVMQVATKSQEEGK